jgi:hypothetical protein
MVSNLQQNVLIKIIMPDINQLFQKLKQERSLRENPEQIGVVPEEEKNDAQRLNETFAQNEVKRKNQEIIPDLSREMSGDPTQRAEELNDRNAERFDPLTSMAAQEDNIAQENRAEWTPSVVNDGFVKNTQTNMMFGLGQMIGDYGNIAQVLGSAFTGGYLDMYEGNWVSKALQEKGEQMQAENTTWAPEEILNPEFKLSTLTDPLFWSTHGGRFLPQLMEIAATYGAAGGVKNLVQSGLKGALKGTIKAGAKRAGAIAAGEAVGEKAATSALRGELRTTTAAAFRGAEGINEVGKAKGLLGRVMTDRGTLTKTFGEMVEGTAGGLISNLRVSLANAGEVYNTYKGVSQTDANGNVVLDENGKEIPMFSEEELGQMAAGTFLNNSQYLAADILSWGLTFGKGGGMLKTLGGKLAAKNLAKKGSALAVNSISPVFKKLATIGGKMAFEGLEESVQETYEEWSKMKAYADVHGSLEGYQGPATENYDTSEGVLGIFNGGFMDFYTSKDSEATRVISAAMGAMAGGAFNLKTLVNKQADIAQKFESRSESLSKFQEKGTDEKATQDYHIRAQMAELVFEGKGEQFVDFAKGLKDQEIITEEDFNKYGAIYDKASTQQNAIKDLKINGKKAYIVNFMEEDHLQTKVDEETEIFNKNVDVLKATIDDENDLATAIKKEVETYKSKVTPLANMIGKTKENQKNLLIGKKANPISYDVTIDPQGNPIYTEKESFETTEEQESRSEEEIRNQLEKSKLKAKTLSKLGNQVWNKIQGIGSTISEVLGINKQDQTSVDPLDELRNANTDDIINIDGIDRKVFGQNLNTSTDGSVSIDYEIETPSTLVYSTAEDKTKGMTVIATDKDGNSEYVDVDSDGQVNWTKDKNEALAKVAEFQKNAVPFKSLGTVLVSKDGNITDKVTGKKVKFTSNKKPEAKTTNPKNEKAIDETAESIAAGVEPKGDVKVFYEENKKEIDALVKIKQEENENLSDEDKELIRQLSEDQNLDTEDSTDDEIIPDFKEVFDKDQAPDEFSDAREKREFINKIVEKIEKQNLIKKSGKILARGKNKAKSFKFGLNRFKEEYVDTSADNQLLQFSQSIEMSHALQQIFPDANANVYRIMDMEATLGTRALGLTVASQIYINEKTWNQGTTMMHEVAHIFYALTPNSPETKSLLNFALKNEALVEKITNLYSDMIQYQNPETGEKLTKKRIFGNKWNSYSEDVRNKWFDLQVQKGNLIEVPIEEQEILLDEIFAATLEGPLSDKYTNFFKEKENSSNEGVLSSERKRQVYAKKWWQKVKKLAEDTTGIAARKEFQQTLSDADKQIYSSDLNTILNAFETEIKGKETSLVVRESRSIAEDLAITQKNEAINELIEKQKNTIQEEVKRQKEARRNNKKETLFEQIIDEENGENDLENLMFDEIFNTDRLQYINKMSGIIKTFSEFYNKAKTLKARELNTNLNKIEFLDAQVLKYKLTKLAETSDSSADFIRRLQEAKDGDLKKFNLFLDKKRDSDKLVVLQSLHWLAKNQSDVTSIKTFVDKNGQVKLETNLSEKELTSSENKVDQMFKDKFNGNENYRNMLSSAENIYNGQFTKQDIDNVFNFLSGNKINRKEMLAANKININGKSYPLTNTIIAFVRSKNGLFNGLVDNKPVFDLGNKNEKFKSGIRTFIKAIVNENRKFTADYNVFNAEGNQTPVKIIDNFLTRNTKKMKEDAARMDKKDFLNKYSHKSGNLKKGKYANQLLNFLYDKIAKSGDIDLVQYDGILNQNNNKSVILKNSDSGDHRLNDFIMFNKSSSKGSYLMDTGRFSDSSRTYLMEVPKIDTEEIISFENKKIVFNDKQLLSNIFNTHKQLGMEMKFEEFKKAIEESIKDQKAFIESNSAVFARDPQMRKFFTDANGKMTKSLNKDGLMAVANFELNQIVNDTNFKEVFFPSFLFKNEKNENESLKRSKSGLSPMFSFPSVSLEAIYVDDIKKDGFTVTDAGFYILEEDAARIMSAGGTVMPLRNGYKLLHTGIEKNNENFKDQNVYNKGYATILNKAEVAKNPDLRGVYDLLKMRKLKWEEQNNQRADHNLLSGTPTYMNIVVPYSANKNVANMPAHYDSKVMSYDSLNSMYDNNNFAEAEAILDKTYYYDKDEQFTGLDGSNFGVQQVMDIDKDTANLGVQFVKSLTTNASVNGNLAAIEDILNDIKNLSSKQIEKGFNIINNGNQEQIMKFFKSLVDLNQIDQVQSDLIFKDGLKLSVPGVRELVKNTFANYIKKNGLKLNTPGNILREKPSTYRKKYSTSSDLNATSGTSDLAFYNKNSDGTYSKGEVVLPKDMILGYGTKDQSLRRREYYVNKNLQATEKFAREKSKELGVGYGKVFGNDNEHIGYYVEGDSIMGTRIPSHGPQTTGFFEVIDFAEEEGNNIQLPNKFKEIVGSDNDGDQIFVQHKGKGMFGWNSVMDKMEKHYLTESTQKELMEPIDFKEDAEKAIVEIEKIYGKKQQEKILPGSSRGKQIAFDDTLISKSNVGIAANLHSNLRLFSNYEVELNSPITIDDQTVNKFSDSKEKSLTIASAKLFNIILDNSKYGFANKLGINKNTINTAMLLTNLGYDLNKVGLILNHPIVKMFSNSKETNSSVFKGEESIKIFDEIEKKYGLKKGSDVNVNTKDIDGSNQSIYNLLLVSNNITNNEMKSIEGILSIHNTMTVNPFEINGLLKEFNLTVNNQNDNSVLKFPAAYKNSPLIQNYVSVLEKNQEVQKKIDPTFSSALENVYNNIIDSTGKKLSKADHNTIKQAMDLFHSSQILNLNNLVSREYYDSLTATISGNTNKKNPKNIFDRLQNYISEQVKMVDENGNNNFNTNMLLSKGLNYSLAGNNKYVSINNAFFNDMMDSQSRKQILNEFSRLPGELQQDLMIYDLMKNGWKGNLSMFTLFNSEFKNKVSEKSDVPIAYSQDQLKTLETFLVKNNPELFLTHDGIFSKNSADKIVLNNNLYKENKILYNKIKKGEPVFFKSDGKIYKFNGFTKSELKNAQDSKSYNDLLDLAMSRMSNGMPITQNFNKPLDYITIKNQNVTNPGPDSTTDSQEDIEFFNDLEESLKKKNNNKEDFGLEKREDNYWRFSETMDRNQFDKVMDYDANFDEITKESKFNRYLEEKQKADKLALKYNEQKLKSMSKESLLNLYMTEGKLSDDDGGVGLGWRDKIAYAKVLKNVVLEIANREAIDQSKLTGKTANGKDISMIQKWLLSNNVPSDHPAIQSLVRNMETKYKSYIEEKSKIAKEINQATDALYKEQFGYSNSSNNLVDILKKIKNGLFGNKTAFYDKLYGPLIIKESVTTANGTVIQNMKYKSKEQIEKDFKSGIISKAQKDFYDVTRKISKELEPFSVKEGKKSRTDYIPHTAPEMMEVYSSRGMLGLLLNSKTLNEKINDVYINATNPITGEKAEGVLFKEVKDWYNTYSKTNKSKAAEFYKLKKKAISLQRKGVNEDGSPLRASNVEIGSAIGDIFVDRFSKSRSVSSSDMPSMDLNKAFIDYASGTIFNNGNGIFEGFKSMVPVVDGIMAQAERDGNPNAAAYVDKIWKQYFLAGKKQQTIPNLKSLEAVGVSSDNVVDYITKGSLIYWLGYKGLAIGGGVYAIGNVLVGKYNNVLNQGGKNWAKGEKRFWLGKDGKFDITDPFKGVKESIAIMKKAGYMDINVFDDVKIEDKSSMEKMFTSLALFPMTWSEKWIQGVHFLGMLNEEQWEDARIDKTIDKAKLTEMENEIKLSHGKGYSATDQRMIQMYSWGRMMMQFSRYIPTMIYRNFGKDDIDIYGKETIGTYTSLIQTIQKGMNGEWSPKTFMKYRKDLPDYKRRQLDKALSGFGLISGLIAVNQFADVRQVDKFVTDSNPFSLEKLLNKFTPASLKMIDTVVR